MWRSRKVICDIIILHLHKFPDPLLSTFLKHLWQDYSLESPGVWCFNLGIPVFGKFLQFFSADPLNLCQVGWRVSLHSYFQVSPEMLDRVQVQALAGPLKDIQRLVAKPLLHCLGCVPRVVEGEPLPLVWGPEQVFIKDLSVLCSVHLSLDTDLPRSPCRWKTSPQHDAATTMLHRRDGARFPSFL